MPAPYFPLSWESNGDQWWYASPIDCAAASGHYELVRELLCIDPDLLVKLTSLYRIRRLETVWDGEDQFNDVAKCRAHVAKNLLVECETKAGDNSLIKAGYGGWLLYTAASAGDVGFVQDLLEKNPLLVFGEGEYGTTEILYAAARSKGSKVFKLLLNFAIGMRNFGGEEGEGIGQCCNEFRWEMVNRAVHCATRGGNLDVLKELLAECRDVLAYRDAQGSTILHSAAGKGQVEVMKHLIASYKIIDSTDHHGNTALHIAAYCGFLPAVEALIGASPSLALLTNKQGDTLLHAAVAGFQVPGFRRIDQQLELIKQLVSSNIIIDIRDLINAMNNQGKTVLHLAVSESIQADLVDLLMTIPSIDLNITDANGMTPLDLLKQHPQSGSSKLLTKQMISAGGFGSCLVNQTARDKLEANLKLQRCIGNNPGTSFTVPDSELFLYVGNEDDYSEATSFYAESARFSAYSEDMSQGHSGDLSGIKLSGGTKRLKGSINSAATRLKMLLQWPKKKSKVMLDSFELERLTKSLDETPSPLRQRFSGGCSLPNNKRAIPVRCDFPSPSAKENFTASLMQGVIIQQPMPISVISLANSPSSPFSRSSMSSPASTDKTKGSEKRGCTVESPANTNGGKSKSFRHTQSHSSKKLMNHYFCFGAQGLAVDNLVSCKGTGLFQMNSAAL